MLIPDNSEKLFRRLYVRGFIVYFYGIDWLIVLFIGYLATDLWLPAQSGLIASLLIAGWFSALAGGMGGAAAMLSRLSHHLAGQRDFQSQTLTSYFLQPLIGALAGVLSLFLIAVPASLIVNFAASLDVLIGAISFSSFIAPIVNFLAELGNSFNKTFYTPQFIALQILVGWLAGFHQQQGIERLQSFTARFQSDTEDSPDKALQLVTVENLDENDPFYFKAWLHIQRRLVKWSYSWGLFVVLYGLAGFLGVMLTFVLAWQSLGEWAASAHPAVSLMMSSVPVGAAGMVGGIILALNQLQEHVSVKQDFHVQHLMSYLVHPFIGYALGTATFFLITTGFLILASPPDPADALTVVDVPLIVMVQIVLGFVAGFRQQRITEIVQGAVDSVVTLIKLILAFLNPVNLFDTTKRAERLDAIRAHVGLFDRYTGDDQAPDDEALDWWEVYDRMERR